MISCLTVTRPQRLESLRRAVRCFERQTFDDRELVIVHDGDARFAGELGDLASASPARVGVVGAESGLTLGQLRNISVEAASGSIICQWDDDDLYHPRRLEVQHDALVDRGASACMMVDQLHLFSETGELYWDDWSGELFPMSFIQGTLMAEKSALVRYPDLALGEDTHQVASLVAGGHRVVPLQDSGYLYVYVYDGDNAWGESHHRAISTLKARSGPLLEDGLAELAERLAEYPIPRRQIDLVDGKRLVPLSLGA